jgi:glycosyltransferase involved in cell wall biosynthesis
MTALSQTPDSRPWVLIPSYQPDERLVGLIDGLIGEEAFGGIIVVNDGSAPERAVIFEKLIGKEGVTVLTHAVNRGKGQALKTGLNHYLLAAPKDSSGICCCDADGQHLASNVAKVAAAGAEAGTFALGVRALQAGTPFRSKLGNGITSFLFTLFTGSYLRDTQTGLRFIPRDEAAFFIGVPYDRFDYEFAALVKYVSDYPEKMIQVPIETVYLDGNASSHYRSLKDSVTIGGVFVKFFSLSLSTAVLDYLVFAIAFHFCRNILASFVIARIASIIYNFTLSRELVFKAKTNLAKQLAKYVFLVAAFMLISWSATVFLSGLFGGYVVLCKAISEGGLFFISFFIQKHFIFNRKKVIKPLGA